MTNVVIFIAGLAIMLLLMMKTKLGPFVCMLLASLGIGMACGLGTSILVAVRSGFLPFRASWFLTESVRLRRIPTTDGSNSF